MEHLLQEITPWVSQYGLWIVFFGMMIEGTMMILLSGVLCYLGLLPIESTIVVAILGAAAGDQLWYLLGRYALDPLLHRFPRLRKRIDKIENSVRRQGHWLAFTGRFIYSGAILFPLALGKYRYPYPRFTLFDTAGITLWALGGIGLGYLLGTGVEKLFGEIRTVEHLLFFIIVLAAAVMGYRYYRGRKVM